MQERRKMSSIKKTLWKESKCGGYLMESEGLVEKAKQFENCVYFEIVNPEVYGILAYHIANYTGVIKPQVHVGMFQDSVLYIKYPDSLNDISIDFRFFPKCWGTVLETYEISKNIENIIINNSTDETVVFNNIRIAPGEMRQIVLD